MRETGFQEEVGIRPTLTLKAEGHLWHMVQFLEVGLAWASMLPIRAEFPLWWQRQGLRPDSLRLRATGTGPLSLPDSAEPQMLWGMLSLTPQGAFPTKCQLQGFFCLFLWSV